MCPVWAFGNRLWVRDSNVLAPCVTVPVPRPDYLSVEMTGAAPGWTMGSGAIRAVPARRRPFHGPLTGKEQRGFRIRSQPDHHWRPSESGS
ncbi:hypothetical protein BU52_23395 [Streptomyces toyocaensis]|uniref:Uncharacterized protein n=1 Tax=Streptomyces toyocaensis TaxID=55952 RepID=A0A081XMK6_STRTO|nr:hypothetical protein BU52_23395 [Streptomyces toyocaensis]